MSGADTISATVEHLHGFLRGSVVMPVDVHLTAPILDEVPVADDREIHG